MTIGQAEVDNIFTYHPPVGTQVQRYQDIRRNAKDFAELLLVHCPASELRDLAIVNLSTQVVMLANASIACTEAAWAAEPPPGTLLLADGGVVGTGALQREASECAGVPGPCCKATPAEDSPDHHQV